MPITYTEALGLVQAEASSLQATLHQNEEIIPLEDAFNRRASKTVHSPHSTPKFPTSAMDGYAVNSATTSSASMDCPLVMEVLGTMAAGDVPLVVPRRALIAKGESMQYVPCVEIMTGARFPELEGESGYFDAVVPIEQTTKTQLDQTTLGLVEMTKSAAVDQHRRLVGNDFRVDDLVITKGQVITCRHVMALASLGFSSINVTGRLRIGVFSTGAELQNPSNDTAEPSTTIPDINRPYIISTLRQLSPNIKADFIASLPDSRPEITTTINHAISSNKYDILLSTGAVSAGKFDFIRPAIESIPGSRIIFHKVAMRPGHPVLFAKLGEVAFFGLPGNPIAAAVCLRFIVEPFLEAASSIESRIPILAKLVRDESSRKRTTSQTQGPCETRVPGKDEFRHGSLSQDAMCNAVCCMSKDQSPAKAKPFLHANCFIHAPPDFDERAEDVWLRCYPI